MGGGGGSGGSVVTVDADIGKNALSLNVALGMTGGSGGQGGSANATTFAASTIQTLGHQSHGLFAQSVGGGGGHGGDVHTYAISAIYGNGTAAAVPIAVGGHGAAAVPVAAWRSAIPAAFSHSGISPMVCLANPLAAAAAMAAPCWPCRLPRRSTAGAGRTRTRAAGLSARR
ncbi:hypothetical protein V6L77_07820 [Pannonibacter sp. Pt2-lr]